MGIQAILVILCCFVCMIQLVELSILRCSSSQYEHYGFCCNKCKPGTFVQTHCNNTTQTICETCKDGTFSSDWTSEEECTICRNDHCQPTLGLIQKCNSTVDNRCGCVKPDQFHHIATDSCRDCRRCQPGKYPVKPCTAETICAPCPENHFSNATLNFRDECVKCTECELYDRMCSSTKDSICGRKLITTSQVQSTAFLDGKQTSTTEKWKPKSSNSLKPNGSNSQKQNGVDTKITVIMIVFITLLVIMIVAMVFWRRRKVSYRARCGFNAIDESIDRSRRTFSFGSLLLRDQPAKIILGLHCLLNTESSNNWRCLAAKLGVPYIQILNFGTNVETAAKEMLHSWGTSDSATLNRLYEALGEIGRDDACVFLEENVEMPESEETDV